MPRVPNTVDTHLDGGSSAATPLLSGGGVAANGTTASTTSNAPIIMANNGTAAATVDAGAGPSSSSSSTFATSHHHNTTTTTNNLRDVDDAGDHDDDEISVAAAKAAENPHHRTTDDSSNRTVLVLYVGGTLGMGLNDKGALEPLKGYLTDKMREMPELRAKGMPKFDILEYENLKDSSDMGPSDWCKMAKDISANYYKYDGFLVCHGTDTMHYTAAALSFMLENLAKPVIVTGAMVPFIEPYNDARRNIIVAMMFAASDGLCEVCLFCNDFLLRGCRAVKCRQTLSAFESPNFPPLSVMGADQFDLREDLLQRQPTGAFSPITALKDSNVVSLLVTMGFDDKEFIKFVMAFGKTNASLAEAGKTITPAAAVGAGVAAAPAGTSSSGSDAATSPSPSPSCAYKKRPIDCIIFEISGLTLTEHHCRRMIANVLQSTVKAGIVAIVSNHDYRGPIRLTYARELRKICPQAVLIHDMTSETAVVKAKYLFGRGLSPEAVRKWMPVSMRGELTPVALDTLIGKL